MLKSIKFILCFFMQTALGTQFWWRTPRFWKVGVWVVPTNLGLNYIPALVHNCLRATNWGRQPH